MPPEMEDKSQSTIVCSVYQIASLKLILLCCIGCGAVPDFDTPEYTTFGSTQTRKWEASEGMDPYSYAYNSATPSSQYKNAMTIVHTLVDIVSKNGN